MNLAPVLFIALTACAVACGEIVPQSQGGPEQPGTPAVSLDAGVVEDGGSDAAPPKRVVERRSPYGNIDPTNLMLDGDFEFSGRQGQMPWLSFAGDRATLDYETGGLCASGVRCAKIGKDTVLFGWMMSPKSGTSIDVTLKVRTLRGKPKSETGACPESRVNIYVIDIENPDAVERVKIDRDIAPINGFCTYHGVVGALPYASPGVYVESQSVESKDVVLLDQVVATPVAPNAAHTRALRHEPITAASKAQMAHVSAWIRTHRKNVGERAPQPLD